MTASFDCDDDGELYQIEYWFNVQGSVASGDFIAIGASISAQEYGMGWLRLCLPPCRRCFRIGLV